MIRLILVFHLFFNIGCKISETQKAMVVVPEATGIRFKPVLEYTTANERTMIEMAAIRLGGVLKSDCFKSFILERRLIQTEGRSNIEVLNHVLSLSGDIPVKMYARCITRSFSCPFPTSAVAYRKPPSLEINLNRVYFTGSRSVCDWASTIAHESLGHALGNYSHSKYWNKDRDYSVPYSLGAAIDACCVN